MVRRPDVASWNGSYSHFSINEFLSNCRERDQREKEVRQGSPSYANLPRPRGVELAVIFPAALVRMGQTEVGEGPRASLLGAFPSFDRILGCPSDSPVAGRGVRKPQCNVVRSGWPLASLGPGPGAALGG